MEQSLAIIIPAYKDRFLDEALESLANQSCRDFTVYIGDDHSPYPLEEIVRKYTDRLNIIYHRFEENMGGANLIAQWTRCVRMVKEEYFCLFSDDDKMEPQNVARFFETLNEEKKYDVYHFDLRIIDAEGNIIQECNPYPEVLSPDDFFRLLYTYRIDARIPEFVFRTEYFWKRGGFVEFDLAFRSDNATVMACAEEQGIRTVAGSKVLWRDSGINISSNKNTVLKKRKALASIDFFNWVDRRYKMMKHPCPFSLNKRIKMIVKELVQLHPYVCSKEARLCLEKVDVLSNNRLLRGCCECYFFVRLYKKKRKQRRK